jgi:hypothetical protein
MPARSHLMFALLLAGCGGVEPPPAEPIFEVVGPLPTGEALAELRRRAAEVSALYAVVETAYDGPNQQGTFTQVAYWQAPNWQRVSAFKDLVLATHPIFEMAFTPDSYSFALEEGELVTGPIAEFPTAQPAFSGVYWAGEAMFLPGAVGEQAQVVEEADEAGETLVVRALLASGAEAWWWIDPLTLRVWRAEVRVPETAAGGGRTVYLEYDDYRLLGGRRFPGLVVLRDPEQGVRMSMAPTEVEVNPALEPWVFELP